jgi:hypothetical protein
MVFGGILIVLGILLLLLDRFHTHKSKIPIQESEIKLGNLSFKGGVAILVLFLGAIVYLLEEGIIKI